YYVPTKNFKIHLLFKPRADVYQNTKTTHPLRNKMNEHLLASFITPTIT
ncbi:hypothetical protein DBR06_SOUSAS20210008, partial [Sousa chinensis]